MASGIIFRSHTTEIIMKIFRTNFCLRTAVSLNNGFSSNNYVCIKSIFKKPVERNKPVFGRSTLKTEVVQVGVLVKVYRRILNMSV